MQIPKLQLPPVILFLFLLISFAFFHHINAGWNINTRLGLTMAIVERDTFSIDAYHDNPDMPYLFTNDKAFFDGHYYCDKSPALSFSAVPVYWTIWNIRLNTALFSDYSHEFFVHLSRYISRVITVSLPAALLGVLLYLLAMRFGVSRRMAFFLSISMLWGSILGAYATLFYPYLPSALCFMGAYAIMLHYRLRDKKDLQVPPPLAKGLPLFWAGLLTGLAWFYEFTTGLVGIGLGAYALWTIRRSPLHIWKYILGGLLPVLAFYAYTYSIFGEFAVPYEYEYDDFFREQMAQGFRGIHLPRLSVLYYISIHPLRGLFFYSPFLLLWFPALLHHLRKRGDSHAFAPDLILSFYVIVAYFAFASGYYMWWGGWAAGTRNLCSAVPFFLPPIAIWLACGRLWKKVILALLILISIVLNFMIVAHDPQIQTNNIIPERVLDRYMHETGKTIEQVDFTELLHDMLLNPRISDNIQSPALKYTYPAFLGLDYVDYEGNQITREPQVALNLGNMPISIGEKRWQLIGLKSLIPLCLMVLMTLLYAVFMIKPRPHKYLARTLNPHNWFPPILNKTKDFFEPDSFGVSTGGQFLLRTTEIGTIILIIAGFILLPDSRESISALRVEPVPDAPELAFMAAAHAQGVSPLLPIVNERVPSRFSPLHSYFASWAVNPQHAIVTQLTRYSMLVTIISIILLYILLLRAGIHPVLRIAFLFLLAFSPIIHAASDTLLQEPTILLFLCMAIVLFHEGLQHFSRNPEGRALLASVLFGASFISAGFLTSIRPPLMVLPLLFIIQLSAYGAFPNMKRLILILSLCFFAVLTAAASYLLMLQGTFSLTNFRTWNDCYGLQSFWAKPITRIPSDASGLGLVFTSLTGNSKSLTAQHWFSMLLVYSGIAGLFQKTPPSDSSRLLMMTGRLLSLFALLCALPVAFYGFFSPFYLLPAYIALMVASVLGWNNIIESVKNISNRSRKRLCTLLLCLTILIATGFGGATGIFSIFTPDIDSIASRQEALRHQKAFNENTNLTKYMTCPFFVEGIPTLTARIELLRTRALQPISTILPPVSSTQSPHIKALQSASAEPRSYLSVSAAWQRGVSESFLYDTASHTAKTEFIDELMKEYGRFALYYTAEQDENIEPLLAVLKEASYLIRDYSTNPEHRFKMIYRDDGLLPDQEMFPHSSTLETITGWLGEPLTMHVASCHPNFLGNGWDVPEKWGDYRRVRWISAREATVFFPLLEIGSAYLTIRLQSAELNDAETQTVELIVNGESLASRTLYSPLEDEYYYDDDYYYPYGDSSPQMTSISWRIPREALQYGFNRITFRFAHATPPSEISDSSDNRPLSAAVEWIELEIEDTAEDYRY